MSYFNIKIKNQINQSFGKKKLNKIKTAFVTFFPIKPDAMGSSTVVNSRFNNWPYKKKFFKFLI